MCEAGPHWMLSSAAGFVLTGQFRPVCSLSQDLPDCAPRRAFERAMERAFAEPGHCARVHRVWLLGRTLRLGEAVSGRPSPLPESTQAGLRLPVPVNRLAETQRG